MLVMIINSKDTNTYIVSYGRLKLPELDDPETISVVVGESWPPRIIIFPSSPGRLQQRWPHLSCLSVREGRGETSVPVIFPQDRPDDDEPPQPPQTSPAQEEWRHLSSCRSWTGTELPLDGLNTSTFLKLSGYPPDIMSPGNINNCQTTLNMRLYRDTMILSLASKIHKKKTYFRLP